MSECVFSKTIMLYCVILRSPHDAFRQYKTAGLSQHYSETVKNVKEEMKNFLRVDLRLCVYVKVYKPKQAAFDRFITFVLS